MTSKPNETELAKVEYGLSLLKKIALNIVWKSENDEKASPYHPSITKSVTRHHIVIQCLTTIGDAFTLFLRKNPMYKFRNC